MPRQQKTISISERPIAAGSRVERLEALLKRHLVAHRAVVDCLENKTAEGAMHMVFVFKGLDTLIRETEAEIGT